MGDPLNSVLGVGADISGVAGLSAKSGQEESAYVESLCCTLQCYMRGLGGRAEGGDGQGWSPRVDGMEASSFASVCRAISIQSGEGQVSNCVSINTVQ
jgi:hypothetical protein